MSSGNRQCLLVFAMAIALIAPATTIAGDEVVVMQHLSPLADRDQIAHRLLSPLARREYDRVVADKHLQVRDQTIVAGQEHYDLFVPESLGAGRYGLLVFVSPSDDFRIPPGWRDILRREQLILIAARQSGNSQDMLGRRVPLALHGYGYASSHYAIDPGRVYVAGFSGGARTAQLIAFAYPDVFRGVLMFAGSDPFGEGAVAPPPGKLMKLVQTRLRIVQSTGLVDEVNIDIDSRTRRSLEMLCIRNVGHVDQPRLGHALPKAAGFAKALAALLAPVRKDADDARCNARLQAMIDLEMAEVNQSIGAGRVEQARKQLLRADAHYGWLAAPQSNEAMNRLDALAPLSPASAPVHPSSQ